MRHSIDFGFPHKLQAITVQRLDQGIHLWRPSPHQKDYAEHRTLNVIDTKIIAMSEKTKTVPSTPQATTYLAVKAYCEVQTHSPKFFVFHWPGNEHEKSQDALSP